MVLIIVVRTTFQETELPFFISGCRKCVGAIVIEILRALELGFWGVMMVPGLGVSKVVDLLELKIVLELFSAQHRPWGIMLYLTFLGSQKRLLGKSHGIRLVVVINELGAECLIKIHAESLTFFEGGAVADVKGGLIEFRDANERGIARLIQIERHRIQR